MTDEYGLDSLVILEYHLTENDPFGIAESDARKEFYGIGGIPASVFAGTETETGASSDLYDRYEQKLLEQWTQRSPVRLRLSAAIDSTILTSQLAITAIDSVPLDSLVLWFAVTEDSINYQAPNGETLLYFVVRSLASIDEIFVLHRGDSLTIPYTLSLPDSWQKNRLGLVAFLQDPQTGKIVQARQLKLTFENYNFSLSVPETLKVSNLDSTTVFPFVIKNTGLLGDTLILDLPDTLSNLPVDWSASICDTLTCFPLPLKIYLEPEGIAQTLQVDIIPKVTTGEGSVVLSVQSKGNPKLIRTQKIILRVR